MVRKTLLIYGAVSSLIYLAGIDVIAALRYPDYHSYTSQMVSELFALGAPTRSLLVPLMLLYNVLVLAFAASICFLGLAVGWWVFYIGAAVSVIALVGWVFEFSRGQHAH